MPAVGPDQAVWLYWRVYTGGDPAAMDAFVLHTAGRLADIDGVGRWFFLRYIDEAGPHIRIRLLPRAEATEFVSGEAERILERWLDAPPPTLPTRASMISPAAGAQIDGALLSGLARDVVASRYEPEFDKFGGAGGVAIAETLFWRSSQLALGILAEESRGQLSRKTCAAALMATVATRFRPRGALDEFWAAYALRWLGGASKAADDFVARSQTWAADLAAAGVHASQLAADEPACGPVIEAWDEALAQAVADYESLRTHSHGRPTVDNDGLAFQFSHLMNNRLGFLPLEEAHLATLLAYECVAVAS